MKTLIVVFALALFVASFAPAVLAKDDDDDDQSKVEEVAAKVLYHGVLKPAMYAGYVLGQIFEG